MSNANTGSLSPESSEELQGKKGEKGNIFSLLKSGISRALGDPIDPVRFNQFQAHAGNLEEEVRQHMKDIKSARGIEWEGVDEKDIQELKKTRSANK